MKNRHRKVPEERFKDKSENYKREISKLRKQVAQLQKDNQRLRNRDEGLQELFEEFGEIKQNRNADDSNKFECPHCGSTDTRFMSLRHENSHFTCNDCGKTGLNETKG